MKNTCVPCVFLMGFPPEVDKGFPA